MKIRAPRFSCAANTLLVTMATLGIVGVVLISYLRLTTNQNQLVFRSQTWNCSLALAEAGVEEALNHCVYNLTNMLSNEWALRNGRYWLSNTLGDGRYVVSISETNPLEIISQGYFPMPGSSTLLSRTVRVGATNVAIFYGGLISRSYIDMNGNKIVGDSYDSRDETKSTLGRYDPAKAQDNCNVGCVEGITDSLYTGNADIYGRVLTGPTATVRTGPQGSVGSKKWHLDGNKGIEPGRWIKDYNVSFYDVTLPFTTGASPSSGSYNGVTYNQIFGGGEFVVAQMTGDTIITGPSIVVVTDRIDYGTGGSLEIAPGASLTVYMAGAHTFIGTVVNGASSATNFLYYGLPTNTRIDIKTGGAAFTGAIYAPHAHLFMNGDNQLYGSAVVASAKLVGHCSFHFDEALQDGPKRAFVITSWDEL